MYMNYVIENLEIKATMTEKETKDKMLKLLFALF